MKHADHSCLPLLFIGGWLQEPIAGLPVDQQAARTLQAPHSSIVSELTTQGLQAIGDSFTSPIDYFSQALALHGKSLRPAGIGGIAKIGLLRDPAQITATADWLSEHRQFVIFDPVQKSSRGLTFQTDISRQSLLQDLLPQVDVITPNAEELAWLVGAPTDTEESLLAAARSLLRHMQAADNQAKPTAASDLRDRTPIVIVTGGHTKPSGSTLTDWIVFGDESWRLHSPRLAGKLRGSGCLFAGTLAAWLSRTLMEASIHTRPLPEIVMDCAVAAKATVANAWRRGGADNTPLPDWQPTDFPCMVKGGAAGETVGAGLMAVSSGLEAKDRGFDQAFTGLYVIADRAGKLAAAFSAGARLGQIRCKDKQGSQLAEEISAAQAAAGRWGARLVVNDDLRLAEAVGAYAVHLGQEDLAKYTRAEIASRKVKLGISTHSFSELAHALTYAPDYIAFGPIHQTTCKSMAFGPQGLTRIPWWRRSMDCPLIAIGGLTDSDACAALAAGADAIAVISDIFNHPSRSIEAGTSAWLAALALSKTD